MFLLNAHILEEGSGGQGAPGQACYKKLSLPSTDVGKPLFFLDLLV